MARSLADVGALSVLARQPAFRSGWVAPTVLYDQIRELDASATSLNEDFVRNTDVGDPTRQAWDQWYAVWRDYVNRRMGSDSAKLGNVLYTDDIQKEIDSKRLELQGFYARYATLTTPSGNGVPPPSGQAPPTPSTPETKPTPPPTVLPSWFPEVPWWVYVLGGAATVGLGYVGYRYIKFQIAAAKAGVPAVKAALGIPSLPASSERDHSRCSCGCGGTCGGR